VLACREELFEDLGVGFKLVLRRVIMKNIN
jgi:hypothetical protein